MPSELEKPVLEFGWELLPEFVRSLIQNFELGFERESELQLPELNLPLVLTSAELKRQLAVLTALLDFLCFGLQLLDSLQNSELLKLDYLQTGKLHSSSVLTYSAYLKLLLIKHSEHHSLPDLQHFEHRLRPALTSVEQKPSPVALIASLDFLYFALQLLDSLQNSELLRLDYLQNFEHFQQDFVH